MRLRMKHDSIGKKKIGGQERLLSIFYRSNFSVLIITVLSCLIIILILVQFSQRSEDSSQPYSNDVRCTFLYHSSIGDINNLTELDLSYCNMTHLPKTIRYASNLVKLDLSFNPLLKTLPPELGYCTKLDVLFVSSCPGIFSIPSVLGTMKSITRLGWKSGSLTTLDDHPENIPPNLVHLILTHNQIRYMNNIKVFKRLSKIRKLMLSHNQLKHLNGKGLVHLRELELLRLGGNTGLVSDGNTLPDELWNLPLLKWLTLPMSNELRSQISHASTIPNVRLSSLDPVHDGHSILGQGASGKVTAYNWNGQNVAVKIIHGVTSDGTAQDELTMYAALGMIEVDRHRVVGCLAIFYDDTCFEARNIGLSSVDPLLEECNKGIVMKRLPAHLMDLALPPTIQEVTRDRYGNHRTFTASYVYNVLRDVATALIYLHDHGIAHGDLYAHNIKVDLDGRAFLLDLGASYSFSVNSVFSEEAKRYELRAFCLLSQELLERVSGSFQQYSTVFNNLRMRCENFSRSINLTSIFELYLPYSIIGQSDCTMLFTGLLVVHNYQEQITIQ